MNRCCLQEYSKRGHSDGGERERETKSHKKRGEWTKIERKEQRNKSAREKPNITISKSGHCVKKKTNTFIHVWFGTHCITLNSQSMSLYLSTTSLFPSLPPSFCLHLCLHVSLSIPIKSPLLNLIEARFGTQAKD